MTTVFASAPGKLVLLGEYAVLEGAPALAIAVDRRAHVRVGTRTDGRLVVRAPQIDHIDVEAGIAPDGGLHWRGAKASAQRLRLITHIWQALSREGLITALYGGVELDIGTAGFVLETAAGRHKLGLGSSAAVTVALASALMAAAGQPVLDDLKAWLAHLLAWHRDWQGGRGSGVDIASSLLGGMLVYRREAANAPARIEPRKGLPAGTHCLFVWSGQSVSTGEYLERLAQWRARAPAAGAASLERLAGAANHAVAAVDGDAAGFVTGVADFAEALRAFADASGLGIFSPQQQLLTRLARQQGAAFKPCGAGGDIGMVVSDDAGRLELLRRSIISAGLHPIALTMTADGVQFAPSAAGAVRGQKTQAVHPGASR